MKTPDQIMHEQGLRVEWLKQYEPDTYDSIRKSMDEFADQYAEWKVKNAFKKIYNQFIESKNNLSSFETWLIENF